MDVTRLHHSPQTKEMSKQCNENEESVIIFLKPYTRFNNHVATIWSTAELNLVLLSICDTLKVQQLSRQILLYSCTKFTLSGPLFSKFKPTGLLSYSEMKKWLGG